MSSPSEFFFQYENKRFIFERALDDDHIEHTIFSSATFYERPLLEALRALMPGGKGIALDVGANIGNHTLYFAGVMGLATIAYEPYPRNYALLQHNVRRNGLDAKVLCRPWIAGASRGFGHMLAPPTNNFGMAKADVSDGAIPVRPLDDELPLPVRVHLLKIDVEGSEIAVLNGAQALLDKHKPLTCVETADIQQFQAVMQLLEKRGYAPVSVHNATPTVIFAPGPPNPSIEQDVLDYIEAINQIRRRKLGLP